jgi:hypothetical protein
MFFALTLNQAVLLCSNSCSQSFKRIDIWDFHIQYVALNKWVETEAVQLLHSWEGRKGRSGTNQPIIILANM